MANELDEIKDPVNKEGKDVNVIEKQLSVKVGFGSLLFEIILWVLGLIPGLVFLFKKIKAKNYFQQLQQKIQHNASRIDNYLEQRVMILQNVAKLVEKSVKVDNQTFTGIAALRGGGKVSSDEERNQMANEIDASYSKINVAFEAYPELRSQHVIADAMQQNSYLQKEITAAREVYNDTIKRWNQDIYKWPTKMIVAAKNNFTTRIPFSTSQEIKAKSRGEFF